MQMSAREFLSWMAVIAVLLLIAIVVTILFATGLASIN